MNLHVRVDVGVGRYMDGTPQNVAGALGDAGKIERVEQQIIIRGVGKKK